jgi:hypothetical protein
MRCVASETEEGAMGPGAFKFSRKWMQYVKGLPETGMGYTIVAVRLRDGRKFEQAITDSGHLTKVRGLPEVPFKEEDIVDITVNHLKWDWSETP